MKKGLPGYVLAVCMAVSMLPAATVAEELAGESQPACTCEEACTAQAMNGECPVCSVEGAVEQDCAGCVVEPCDSDEQGAADEDGLTPPADADKPAVADAENPADVADDAVYGDTVLGDADADVEGALAPAAALPASVAAVQALIDSLPDAQNVTDEARADLEAQLGAIDEAKAALSDDELAMLDFARYEAAAAALGETYDLMTLEDTLQARISAGGTAVLSDSETISEALVVHEGVTVILDLNGHSITMTGNDSVIKVDGGNLILQDSVGTGTITGGAATLGGGVCVSRGSFVMNGGTITGCSADNGGGVGIASQASFTMNGGAIVACEASGLGGGVYNFGGAFTLTNGTITGCSSNDGAGVYSLGGFTMEGGSITRCRAPEVGFVVHADRGSLTMSGGVIDAEGAAMGSRALCIDIYISLVVNGGTIRGSVLFDGASSTASRVKATVDGATTAFFGTVTNEGIVSAGIYYGELVNKPQPAGEYGRVDGKQITFVDPGVGNYAVEVVAADRVSIAPIDPVREGRTFVAWYRDEACTQEYVFGAAVSEDLTLYAGWDLDTYTVTYASDGLGEGDGGQAVKVHDRDLELAGALFTREGYIQNAWRDADGSGWPLGGTYGVNAPTTLYPVWRDTQVPVIGLESGRRYCGEVAFSVTDNESVALVKANDEPLTPGSDGL